MDVMRQLRDMTRETVLLGTLLNDAMIVLEQIPGSHPFKFILARFNARTITRKSEFKKALKSIQKKGYAVDCAEQLEGVHCIGAPY